MTIPSVLKPKKEYKLIRVGNNFDGGYLVGSTSLQHAEILISFGICDDWTFEKDFRLKNNKCEIFCYDDKLILKFLLKKFIKSIFFLRNLSFIKYAYKIIDFYKTKKTRVINFVQKKISYNDLEKILSKITNNNIFLKIDIEGSEYRLLDEILLNQTKLIGIVIEFHDFDYHRNIICNFVERLDLNLIHIHPNNYCCFDRNNDPNVLELTFEKNPVIIGNNYVHPHKLDMKNNPFGQDIFLNFEK